MSEVCWIRLDFDLFTLAGPLTVSNTDGVDSTGATVSTEGLCTDMMEVTVS